MKPHDQPQVPTPGTPITVGLVGGKGAMGQVFAQLLRSHGCQVLIMDKEHAPDYQDITRAQLVLVGVPLEQTQAVISTLAPRLKPHQLLVDFTSLKVAPIQAMLKSPACVIGSHPLFGHIIDPKGQNIVLCAARPGGWLPWLEHFFTQSGLSITHMQPQAHDELMALVQGLTHFILMGFANTLRSENADLLQLLQHSTPAWRALATPTAHMLKGHANLYAQIQTLNPHTPATLSAFIQQAQHLLEKIQTGQTPAIVQAFEKSAEFFASPSDKILQ